MAKIFTDEELIKENKKLEKLVRSNDPKLLNNKGESYKLKSLGPRYLLPKYKNYNAYINYDGKVELILKDETKKRKLMDLADYNEKQHKIEVKDTLTKRKKTAEVDAREIMGDPDKYAKFLQEGRDKFLTDQNAFLKYIDDNKLDVNNLARDKESEDALEESLKTKARVMLRKLEKQRNLLYDLSAANYDLFDDDTEFKATLEIFPKKAAEYTKSQEVHEEYREAGEVLQEFPGGMVPYDPLSPDKKVHSDILGKSVSQPELDEYIKGQPKHDPLKKYKDLPDEELIKLLSK